MKKYIKYLLIVTILISNFSNAQISSRKIDKLVKEARKTFNVAGCAVGVVKDGKIIHSKGYGVKSIETNEPVNKHTNFAIASNTKAFTTTALAILVDEGKLSWNDKVVDYIPEFRMYNDYVTHNFTISDLVSHRSGLGKGAGDLMWWPDENNFKIEDIISNFQYFKPKSDLRTKYAYNNVLFFVAGEVIKRVSGFTWEEFVKENVLKPLNMDNTYTSITQITDFFNVATPHSTESGKLATLNHHYYNIEKVNGAAYSIYSNVDDLCNWMLLHLNKGKYGENLENKLFSMDNYRKMWKIHTSIAPDTSSRYSSHFAGAGLGWFMEDKKGKLVVDHGGSMPGMRSAPNLIPDIECGVFILTNTYTGGSAHRAIIKTIVDSYLEADDYDWINHNKDKMIESKAENDSITSEVWKSIKLTKNDNINTRDYIGVYEDNWFGKVEVFINENQLCFKSFRSQKLNGQMHFYKGSTFVIRWEYQYMYPDAFAIFSLNEEGKAQSIKLKGISPNIDFSYDFQDLDLKRINEE